MGKEAKKITRERLARDLRDQWGDLPLREAVSMVDYVFDRVLHYLRDERGVFIHGLGTLHVERQAERVRYVPAKGCKVSLPPKRVPRFRPSKELTQALNQEG